MKANLRLAGVILIAIGFAILVSMPIVGIITPNYNYHDFNGFRVPEWLGFVASLIIFTGLLLILAEKRKANRTLLRKILT